MAMPPRIPRPASSFSDEKYRSAINPTKNGEIIDPIAKAPYAHPTSCPVNFRTLVRYVPRLMYHAPQMKYCRNMKIESLVFRKVCIALLSPAPNHLPNFRCLRARDVLFKSGHVFCSATYAAQ